MTGPTEPGPSEDRWFLTDEQEFLLRSLDDAESEHDAGDLSDADYEVLVTRDRQRLVEVVRALSAIGPAAPDEARAPSPPETPPPPGTRRNEWRRIGIVAACFLIVAGVVILVAHAVSPRLPGQSISGGITVSKEQLIEQQLSQALTLNNGGKVLEALQLYNKVLHEDPDDPDALAAVGFLEWNYGTEGDSPTLKAEGRKEEEKAIRVAPTFYGGHLFLGLILLNQDHAPAAAVKQFNDFLADHPSAGEVQSVAALVRGAYTEAGVPVPAALTAGGATTTTSSTP